MIRIYFLMLLLHVLAEFILQPLALCKLKKKSFWEQPERQNGGTEASCMAITINSIMWTIMIMLPLMCCSLVEDLFILLVFLVDMAIHAFVDEYFTNRQMLTFATTQSIYLAQITLTFLVFQLISVKL